MVSVGGVEEALRPAGRTHMGLFARRPMCEKRLHARSLSMVYSHPRLWASACPDVAAAITCSRSAALCHVIFGFARSPFKGLIH